MATNDTGAGVRIKAEEPDAEGDISMDAHMTNNHNFITGTASSTNPQTSSSPSQITTAPTTLQPHDSNAEQQIGNPNSRTMATNQPAFTMQNTQHVNPHQQQATAGIGGDVTDPAAAGTGAEPSAAAFLPPTIQRKDKNLREFLAAMDEYAPIIPDAVTDYYLALSGLSTTDTRLKRLLALATQKFISDIATDAYQYSRIRSNTTGGGNTGGGGFPGAGAMGGLPGVGVGGGGAPGVAGGAGGGGGALRPMPRPGFGGGGGSGANSGRAVLTMEDLGAAVAEYGVNTRRPEFYR